MSTTITLWDGREVPRIGVGCWAIGGAMNAGDTPLNYGNVDDSQSLAGLKLAYDLGARVFDTAPAYGGGHSEELLGAAFRGREDIVLVTKVGHDVDPDTRQATDNVTEPAAIRASIERSRKRLRSDCIDLVLLHINEHPVDEARPIFETLGHLRNEGKIGAFGWSTDHTESARAFADRDGFVAVEHDFNVLTPARELVELIEEKNLVSINRLPLGMGLLTGKYSAGEKVGPNDLRAATGDLDWVTFFKDGGGNPDYLRRLEAIRDLLGTDGRSLAQGALCWILAKSQHALPVPGFKSEAQIGDNLGALEKGPLPEAVMSEIDAALSSREFA